LCAALSFVCCLVYCLLPCLICLVPCLLSAAFSYVCCLVVCLLPCLVLCLSFRCLLCWEKSTTAANHKKITAWNNHKPLTPPLSPEHGMCCLVVSCAVLSVICCLLFCLLPCLLSALVAAKHLFVCDDVLKCMCMGSKPIDPIQCSMKFLSELAETSANSYRNFIDHCMGSMGLAKSHTCHFSAVPPPYPTPLIVQHL
jgi:hypothetical protein